MNRNLIWMLSVPVALTAAVSCSAVTLAPQVADDQNPSVVRQQAEARTAQCGTGLGCERTPGSSPRLARFGVNAAPAGKAGTSAEFGSPNAELVFDGLDVDANGSLTLDEFLSVDKGRGAGYSPGQARMMCANRQTRFECMDADADGRVSRAEFIEAADVRWQTLTTKAKRGVRGGSAKCAPASKGSKRGNRAPIENIDDYGELQ